MDSSISEEQVRYVHVLADQEVDKYERWRDGGNDEEVASKPQADRQKKRKQPTAGQAGPSKKAKAKAKAKA